MPMTKKSMIKTIANTARYQDNCLVLTTAAGFVMGDLVPEDGEMALIPDWSSYADAGEHIVLKDVRVRVGTDPSKPDFKLEFMVVFLDNVIGASIGKKRT